MAGVRERSSRVERFFVAAFGVFSGAGFGVVFFAIIAPDSLFILQGRGLSPPAGGHKARHYMY